MEWHARQLNRRGNLWRLSDEELDSVQQRYAPREGERFRHGELIAALDGQVLTRDQLLVLHAINGLDLYVRRVGLVNKLMPAPVREDPDTVLIGDAWVDVPGSLALRRTYGGARQVVLEGRWVDPGSASIPL
ncbi:MAG TPA: hypothetical protein VM764_00790 [Gemmatimonadaceae bacterium]|jgi:hypothetical protein|nr:hypothetical protein [Gemmatimonadaceae bacterium]